MLLNELMGFNYTVADAKELSVKEKQQLKRAMKRKKKKMSDEDIKDKSANDLMQVLNKIKS